MPENTSDHRLPKSRRYLAIGLLILAVIVIAAIAYHFIHPAKAAAPARKPASTQVTVATVSSLSPTNAPLSVIGAVTSESQATILAQAAGEIVTLDKGIGDQVAAGETIATIDDSSQQAALVEAQGAYDAANDALTKAGGSASTVSASGAIGASDADAQTSLAASLQSAYLNLDDAVHTKADVLFNYPRSGSPALIGAFQAIQFYQVNGVSLTTTVEEQRAALESVLARDYSLAQATSSGDLQANVSAMASDAQTVASFLDDLSQAVNQLAIQNIADNGAILPAATISGYQTAIAAARTEAASAVTALSGTINTYDSSGQEAQVEEARGSLEAAKAALAKTVIVSPVSGTIVDLPITQGDYVSSGQQVAEVSDPSALKIITHVSATDARTLAVGNVATVNDSVTGTISQISPAIDPQTGTIEVDVALGQGSLTGLTDGDSVTVALARTPSAVSQSETATGGSASVIIPIVSLKITPTGPEVFTVDPAKNILVPHPVQIGSILGDDIVVTEGLAPDTMIVTDARGLTQGQAVSVAKSPSTVLTATSTS